MAIDWRLIDGVRCSFELEDDSLAGATDDVRGIWRSDADGTFIEYATPDEVAAYRAKYPD